MPEEPDASTLEGAGAAHREVRWSYGSFQVDVRGPASAILWLAEFFEPAFETRDESACGLWDDEAGDVRWAVDLVEDAEELASLRARVSGADARPLDAFTLDGNFTQLPTWSESVARRLVLEPGAGAIFRVDAPERRLRIVASSLRGDAGGRVRLATMRVIRELATVATLERGALPLHAAAFMTDVGVFAACGPKRSGKSSLLVHALSCGASFVANDRAFLEPGSRDVLRGMPTLVMLRDGTLDLFPALRAAYDERAFDRARTIAECAPGIERNKPVAGAGHDRPGLTPTQLRELARCSASWGGPLRAFLFPTLDAGANGLRLERMDAPAASRALKASLLLPSSPPRLSAVFANGSVATSEALSAACDAAAERVPAFLCRLGPDAYETDLGKALAEVVPPTEEGRQPPGPGPRRTGR